MTVTARITQFAVLTAAALMIAVTTATSSARADTTAPLPTLSVRTALPFPDVSAYKVLKPATETFTPAK